MSLPWQRSATEIVMLSCIAIWIGWDLYAAFTPSATISEITINFAYRHPALWWLFGCLLAHLSWPMVSTRPHWQTIIVVVVTIAIAAGLDIKGWIPAMMPILPLVVGLPCGHLLWPQKVATETGAALVVQSGSAATTIYSRTLTTILTPPNKPMEKP